MDEQNIHKKKITIRRVLAFLIILLAIALILRWLTPVTKPVVVPTQTPLPAPLVSVYKQFPDGIQLEKNFSPPTVPLTLPTASANLNAFPIEQFKTQTGVINELSPIVWNSLDEKDFITYDKYAKSYEYVSPKTNLPKTSVNLNQSIQQGITFFKSYGVTNISPILDNVQYFKTSNKDSDFASATEKDATVVKIPFANSLSGLSVYINNNLAWDAEVYVTNAGDIYKATIPGIIYNFTITGQVNTLSTDQVLEDITSATIINVDDPTYAAEPIQGLTRISVTKAEIEYRLNTGNRTVLPYYRFTGTGTKADGSQIDIQFILPASNSTTN